MMKNEGVPWLSYGALALSMALVGSYVALSKPLVAALPVFLLAWLRFAIGALAMHGWVKKPPEEPALDGRTRMALFFESFLGNFLFSLCMLFGISLTTATAAGVIMAALPAVVAVLSALFLREAITPRTRWAIALAVTGIGLFSLGNASPASLEDSRWMGIPLPLIGNALILCAVFCEASYVVIGKRLTGRLGPKRISALINLWGLALMTPLGAWALLQTGFPRLTPDLWALLMFYGLAASVWTVWLWMYGMKTVPASQAGVFTILLPLSTALVGVLFLDESLSLLQWLAFGIALAGLLVATAPGIRRTRDRSDR
jgi:drug/metabolite transporter (DMT)-like permease